MRLRLLRLAEGVVIVGLGLALAWAAHLVWRPVRVGGWSMHPALHVGDVVIVGLDSSPGVGDVALMEVPGHAPVLHRVKAVLPDGRMRTQGDANGTPDRELASASDVRGRVVGVVPVGVLVERWRGDRAYATMTTQSNSTQP